MGGVEGHEPTIGLLGIAVEVDGPLQGVSRGVGLSGVVFELGQAEVGVEGSAVEVLTDRFDPGVVASLEEVAAIGVDGLAQCGSGLVVGGPGGICEGRLELPQVAGDLGRARLVVLAGLGEHVESFVAGTSEPRAQIAEGTPELLTDTLGSGVRPQRVDGLVAGGAFGADQVPRRTGPWHGSAARSRQARRGR